MASVGQNGISKDQEKPEMSIYQALSIAIERTDPSILDGLTGPAVCWPAWAKDCQQAAFILRQLKEQYRGDYAVTQR